MKEIKGEGPPKYNEDHLKILLANSDPIRYSVLYLIRYSVLYVIRYSFATLFDIHSGLPVKRGSTEKVTETQTVQKQ